MCATNDPVELKKLRRRTKPIRAWKILQKSGVNVWTSYAKAMYGPGQVKARGVTRATCYRVHRRHGLHVYRTARSAERIRCIRERIVSVYIDPQDLIAAEHRGIFGAQLVTCRLTIQPEDWAAAGFPKRTTRRRYI